MAICGFWQVKFKLKHCRCAEKKKNVENENTRECYWGIWPIAISTSSSFFNTIRAQKYGEVERDADVLSKISKLERLVQNQGLFWATDCSMRGALEVRKSGKADVGKSKCGLFLLPTAPGGGRGGRRGGGGTVRGGGLACRGQGAHFLPPILPYITQSPF